MKYTLLVKKLLLDNEKYVSKEKLIVYGNKLGLTYTNVVKYLLKYGYIRTIMKGFFYVPSIEERKLKNSKPIVFEAISKVMEYKNANYYFGLETGLKLNNITHEFFSIDFVLSDTIFRAKTTTILNHKIRFVKLNKKLFGFGLKKSNGIVFSDLEKTLLDIIHLRKYNGYSNDSIKNEIIEWVDLADKKRLLEYSKNYSKSVKNFLGELK
jgi:predicted transcriptional regulator of viral defense system